jgi:hydroxyacylglutathione hydrolase
MTAEITFIRFGGMLGYGVNCYLVKGADGYILVDTAISPRRLDLEKQLESAGCKPGNLKLIVLTHGHGDHTGNIVYLRDKYAAPIAMHRGDLETVEQTAPTPSVFERVILKFLSWIAGIGETQRFTPDIFLEDGQSLAEYGWDARVIHIPGHSNGSIGILTAAGDPSIGRQAQPGSSGQVLFCGDVFVNVKKPARHTIVTDAAAFDASVEKLKSLGVHRV